MLKKDLSHMNLLRAVGITLVVLRHSFSPFRRSWDVSKYYEYNIIADCLGKYISTISMPLFVFISGYIYYFLRNNYGKYSDYKTLFKKKSRRLIVPYLILAPIYIYFLLDYDSMLSFLSHMWTGAGHLWFLLMMFVMFLLYYKFENFLCKHYIFSILLGVFLYMLVLPLSYINLQPLALVCKYFIFFQMGNLFNKYSTEILGYLKGKVLVLFLMHLFLFGIYFYAINVFENKYVLFGISKFLLVLSILALCFIYGFLNIVTVKYVKFVSKIKPVISYINHNSYYLYLIHEPLLKVFFTFLFVQKMPIVFAISLAFILSMGISLFLGNLLMKLKIGRALIGS
ncbi:acyltransferase family protein [Winogradskyella forsetii]|uniref:acyltransferase family protein n=1 Tax=Winogradskyella forsetii TaxID=2686077 RepID=UPI0015BD0A22|nr:acyltransferase family protein [Winogradskyella forsetii]